MYTTSAERSPANTTTDAPTGKPARGASDQADEVAVRLRTTTHSGAARAEAAPAQVAAGAGTAHTTPNQHAAVRPNARDADPACCPIRRAVERVAGAAGSAARGAWRDRLPPAERLEATPRELICHELWGGNEPVHRPVRMPGFAGVIFSRPCGGASGGGDVHFFTACNAGEICRICLADIAGHGQAVSQVSGWLHRLLQRHMNQFDPSRVFDALNDRMFETGEWAAAGMAAGEGDADVNATPAAGSATRVEALPELLFATAIAISYDASKQILSWCSAGHVPALVHRHRDGAWLRLDELPQDPAERPAMPSAEDGVPVNLPLGVLGDVRFSARRTRLAPGDRLVLFSDGLIELPIVNTEADERTTHLGIEGLRQLLHALSEQPTSDSIDGFGGQLVASLYEVARDHTLGHDDITFVVLEARPADPRPFPVRLVQRKVRQFSRWLRPGRSAGSR